jgi:dCTP deaminase
MIINGTRLLEAAPLRPMATSKQRCEVSGTSWGLSEAGYDLRLDQDIKLTEHDRFCLASSMEEFTMPDRLVGIVHDKSTHARRGLSVFNTVIEPSWRGYLTLELVWNGSGVLHLLKGCGIAQVIFHQIAEPADYGNGKYQDQQRGPQEARR